MIDEEEHECPVCVTIPPGKILQCKEGHILCETCILTIQKEAKNNKISPKCPCCAGPLGDASVSRNRALENILDRLTFDCQYAKDGCVTKLKRGEIKDHETCCKFGIRIGMCKLFGIPDCLFKLSLNNADTAQKHLETSHTGLTNYGNSHEFCINVKQARARAQTIKMDTANVLLTTEDGEKTIVVNLKVTQNSFSFSCVDLFLCLSIENRLQVTCSIPNEKDPMISWSFAALSGFDTWKFTEAANSQLEIGIQSILQLCDEIGNITIHLRVKSLREVMSE